MSAGICGKRVGFEEIFACSPAAKRSRCSGYGSPIRSSDFGPGSGSDDRVLILLQMFPALSRELVETVLKTHNDKIEDAIESLHVLSLGDVTTRNESQDFEPAIAENFTAPQGIQMSEEKVEDIHCSKPSQSTFNLGCVMDGSNWVDIFVHEMMNATDINDARGRAARILEAFEKSIVDNSKASEAVELASLREHVESLLRDNQILKRAVAIQHERNVEQEEKANEVQQFKHVITQYQEQLRTLEVSNYTLKLHLQRAQESSCIPGQFHPDIF